MSLQNTAEMIPIELKKRTKLFFKKKGVTVKGDFVRLKDALDILHLGSKFNTDKIGSYPECQGEGCNAMIPMEYLPFVIINSATGGLKKPEARQAVMEYIDFMGIPMPSIWNGDKFYIVQHKESGKLKAGTTGMRMSIRLANIKRYHAGTFVVRLVLARQPTFENNFRNIARRFKTTPPNNPDHAVGKSEWYENVPEIENFIREHQLETVQHS